MNKPPHDRDRSEPLLLDQGTCTREIEHRDRGALRARVEQTPMGSSATLVDASGDGARASTDAIAAIDCFASAENATIERAFEIAHEALRSTDGVMASHARIDASRRVVQIAGVGNIAARVIPRDTLRGKNAPIIVPGSLGRAFRRVRVTELSFDVGDVLILSTSRVRRDVAAIDLAGLDAERAASRIVELHGEDGSNAACIVVRGLEVDATGTSPGAQRSASGEITTTLELGRLALRIESDAQVAAFETRRISALLGLSQRATWELSIAVAELASNAVRHGGGGVATLSHDLETDEIVIEVRDVGQRSSPAMRPGLGVGLEASRRMLDELAVNTDAGRGLVFVARKKISS